MTKKIDQSIKGLGLCVRGMEGMPRRMWKPTIMFLWDKYVIHPTPEPEKEADKGDGK